MSLAYTVQFTYQTRTLDCVMVVNITTNEITNFYFLGDSLDKRLAAG